MIDHGSYVCLVFVSFKLDQISDLKDIQTHDLVLCDIGAVLHQLSYQGEWQPVMLINSLTHVHK